MIDTNTKLDSKEGMEYAMHYAKAHKLVLNTLYRNIARKYGVSIHGVMFND